MKVKSVKDKEYNECDERVVIYCDDNIEWCRDYCDHILILWSNISKYRGDKNAESPFEEDDDGNTKLKDGIVAFPISVYEHGSIFYQLGEYHGSDSQWDSVNEAFYLWCDKERYEEFMGKGAWDKEDRNEKLNKYAEGEVKELNLDAQGFCYGFRVEKKRKYKKVYEDGEVCDCCEWDNIDGCGGFLTDDVNDLDLPNGIQVFADESAWNFVGDEIKGE